MKKILKMVLVTMVGTQLWAGEYGSPEVPIVDYVVKAKAAGIVLNINNSGNVFSGMYLELDNKYENDLLKNNKKLIDNNKDLLNVRSNHYNKIKDLNGKNEIEKDGYKISLLAQNESVLTLEKEKINIEDSINNKQYKINNMYVYENYVDNGEYVTNGQNLFRVQDISVAKVEFYVDKEDVEKLKNEDYKISDKKYKLKNILKVADDNYVFMYKATFEKKVEPNEKIGSIIKLEI